MACVQWLDAMYATTPGVTRQTLWVGSKSACLASLVRTVDPLLHVRNLFCAVHFGQCLQVRRWCSANVGSNPEQAEAVRCIVAGTSGLLPFIIWGPPGTGKTSTLVEAAAQVGNQQLVKTCQA